MADYPSALSILSEAEAMTLATIGPGGEPRATPVYFAYDEQLNLVFLSDEHSLHSRNLERDARAAVAIYPQVKDWRSLRGVQMKGDARRVAASERGQAQAVYRQRFPFVAALSELIGDTAFYRFVPTWVRWIDNRRGFGFQEEWTPG
jgi:uncharacterized protein YhbP (UPF0306 family)